MRINVIPSAVGLQQAEENRIELLRNDIKEGIDSGIAKDFNPQKHLESLSKRRNYR